MKDLAEALAKAQAEMSNPSFDKTNPHFKSKFASLTAVRNAVVPILAKHGIFVTQDLTTTPNGVACTTIFIKGDDKLMIGPLEMPAAKTDAQGFGSAATYARRYALMAACGVVGDEDDDGNAASDPAAKVIAAKVTPTAGVLESLGADVQQKIRSHAAEIEEAFDKAGVAEAWKIYAEAQEWETEEKVALRGLLGSTCKTALRKYSDEQRKAA